MKCFAGVKSLNERGSGWRLTGGRYGLGFFGFVIALITYSFQRAGQNAIYDGSEVRRGSPPFFSFLPSPFSVLLRRVRATKLEKQLTHFLHKKPSLGNGVFIANGAVILGDVSVGSHSSVWFNAVLRGDINRIAVGHHTNIQDNAVLHLADDYPCIVGNYVTVGHSAIVHACTVGDEVLVGMGSTILDGAVVGRQSLIGANALVTQGMKIPPGSLVLGSPAKVVRQLTPKERASLNRMAEKYVALAGYYLKNRPAPI